MTTTLNLTAGQQVTVRGQIATVLNDEQTDGWAPLTGASIIPVRWINRKRGQSSIYTVRRDEIYV